MRSGDLYLLEYDEQWPVLYTEISEEIRSFCKERIQLHHVGSTAIPGLCAKPIIDILLELEGPDLDSLVAPFERAGYIYREEYNKLMPFRRFFKKVNGEGTLAHIHCVLQGHNFIRRHLMFRDYLRLNPDRSREYCLMKRKLVQSGIERKNYPGAKTEFIRETVREAYYFFHGEYPSESLWSD